MKGLLLIILLAPVLATAQESAKWVESRTARFLPGQEAVRAKTYFEDSFGRMKGKFKAVYESFLEEKDFVEGEFLVARFTGCKPPKVSWRGARFPMGRSRKYSVAARP
jgi:hypothetical protein